MNRKSTARTAGALFVTATAAGVASAVLLAPLDTLTTAQSLADKANRILAGGLMVLVMAGAIAMIPAALFPVLKEHGEGLAFGYFAARILEAVLIFPAAIGPVILVTMGSPGDAIGNLVRTQDVWGYASSSVFFCLSVLLLNLLLFKSRLVPRWLSGWALVAVVPYLVDACLVMFGVISLSSAIHPVLFVPLALNEMVLAIWLLTKGFRTVSPATGH